VVKAFAKDYEVIKIYDPRPNAVSSKTILLGIFRGHGSKVY